MSAIALEALKAHAAAQLAALPQYNGHFKDYVLVVVKQRTVTKLGLAFEKGEVAIAKPEMHTSPNRWMSQNFRFRFVYSIRNRCDTSLPERDVEVLNSEPYGSKK